VPPSTSKCLTYHIRATQTAIRLNVVAAPVRNNIAHSAHGFATEYVRISWYFCVTLYLKVPSSQLVKRSSSWLDESASRMFVILHRQVWLTSAWCVLVELASSRKRDINNSSMPQHQILARRNCTDRMLPLGAGLRRVWSHSDQNGSFIATFHSHCIANCPQNAPVKELWKSINIWQRYGNDKMWRLRNSVCSSSIVLN